MGVFIETEECRWYMSHNRKNREEILSFQGYLEDQEYLRTVIFGIE